MPIHNVLHVSDRWSQGCLGLLKTHGIADGDADGPLLHALSHLVHAELEKIIIKVRTRSKHHLTISNCLNFRDRTRKGTRTKILTQKNSYKKQDKYNNKTNKQ